MVKLPEDGINDAKHVAAIKDYICT